MANWKRNFVVPGCLGWACLALAVVGCKQETPEKEEVVRPVKIHKIGSLDPAAYRDYPGSVKALQEARMGFEVSGLVTEFLVQEGDKIEKGQILAKLDSRDYDAALRAAKADLRKAESDRDRSLGIKKKDSGAISAEKIEQDMRAVEVADAQLAIAQKAVDDTELRAPFAGQMARKLVPDFANVQAKEAVLILQDTSVLEIEVDVPERDFARRPRSEATKEELTKQLAPEVVVSAVPDRTFAARIKEFATTAEPITRTFAVTFNFDPVDDVMILPGMTARVKVVVDPERAWSVPASAVQEDADSPYVWKVDPKTMTVHKAAVELAEGMSKDRLRLKTGVEAGDLIAISGVTLLRDGKKVREFITAQK